MQNQEYSNTSRYLCYLLRHKPESVGLTMDRHGWVNIEELIQKVNTSSAYLLTDEQILAIVKNDDKSRFRISEDCKRIKACQGHSIPWVEPELEQRTPPKYLYHGTTVKAFEEIKKSGAILKMSRHAVHLHADKQMAWQVACRRKNKTPIILKIDSGAMAEQGFVFSISENSIWFCDWVPIEYITNLLISSNEN